MSSSSVKPVLLKNSPRSMSHRKLPSDTGSQVLVSDDTGSSDIDEDNADWSGAPDDFSSEGTPSRPLLE